MTKLKKLCLFKKKLKIFFCCVLCCLRWCVTRSATAPWSYVRPPAWWSSAWRSWKRTIPVDSSRYLIHCVGTADHDITHTAYTVWGLTKKHFYELFTTKIIYINVKRKKEASNLVPLSLRGELGSVWCLWSQQIWNDCTVWGGRLRIATHWYTNTLTHTLCICLIRQLIYFE